MQMAKWILYKRFFFKKKCVGFKPLLTFFSPQDIQLYDNISFLWENKMMQSEVWILFMSWLFSIPPHILDRMIYILSHLRVSAAVGCSICHQSLASTAINLRWGPILLKNFRIFTTLLRQDLNKKLPNFLFLLLKVGSCFMHGGIKAEKTFLLKT